MTAENTKEWVKQCNTQNRELWLEIDRIANLEEELIEALSVNLIIAFNNKSTELKVYWIFWDNSVMALVMTASKDNLASQGLLPTLGFAGLREVASKDR